MQGIHKEGEFRQLEIWTWKSYVKLPILHTPNKLKLHEDFFWNIWELLEQITTRGVPPGGHNPPGRAREPRRALVGCAHPRPPPVPIFWYIGHLDLEKIRRRLLGRSATVSRRNLGRSTFALRRSDSAGGTSLPEGEIIVIIITNNSPILGGQSPSTSSIAPSHLKTLVHLLYPILYQNHKLVPVGC